MTQPTAEQIRPDGVRAPVCPAQGPTFTLQELQAMVGGDIEIQDLPKTGGVMVLHAEGKLLGLPVNPMATALWRLNYPADEEPLAHADWIVGPVVICARELIDEEDAS